MSTRTTIESLPLPVPPPDDYDQVALFGDPIRITNMRVPIGKLDLDPENPRLRYKRVLNPTTPLKELLFEEDSTHHLKDDIKANGLLDRPYVMQHEGDRFLVKEGNRRLTCLTRLHDDDPNDVQWQTVPVRVFPPETTAQQIALMMASYHVTGKDKWEAHEKAGHIYDMYAKQGVTMDALKSVLHMGQPAIEKTMAAYKMMMEVFTKVDGGKYGAKATDKWSFFAEFYKIGAYAKRATAGDHEFVENFCRWVGEGRIPQASHVRDLPEILQLDRSRNLFEISDPKEAYRIAMEATVAAKIEKRLPFYKVLSDFIAACNNARMLDVTAGATEEIAKAKIAEANDAWLKFRNNVARQM